jgi:hypothetical protein
MASRPFRVRMSDALAEAFDRDMKKAGYGPRKKGVWVGEALQQLDRDDPQLQRCGVGDDLDAPRSRTLGISLEREDFSLLQSLVLRFRQGSPLVEGVRALVVRSAIRSRIRLSSKTLSSS